MGLGSDLIQLVRTLLNDQQSCVMNNGITTGYFKLNRSTRQGDPLSAYSFALAIADLFIMIRETVDIKGPNLFGKEVKLTVCADDTTLFLRNLSPLIILLQTFENGPVKPGLHFFGLLLLVLVFRTNKKPQRAMRC